MTVDWGDGHVEHVTSDSPTHTHDAAGGYTVTVDGEVTEFSAGVTGSEGVAGLVSVDRWPSTLQDASYAFNGAVNLESVAEPPTSLTNYGLLFYGAENFNGDVTDWEVSHIESMNGMFMGADDFNRDISSWDVGNVEVFISMFSGASSFNQDLGDWDVSSAIEMDQMFYMASSFDQDLSSWDVSNLNVSPPFWFSEGTQMSSSDLPNFEDTTP